LTPPVLVEHFFRHEYGRLVALLACRVGVQHVGSVEDAVQSSFIAALEAWKLSGLPDNPTAWLFKVASNTLIGDLRQRKHRERIQEQYITDDMELSDDDMPILLRGEISDELLRMLFVCCDPSIPEESQLVLALKILCGFNVQEIALRLFTSETNVYKRLGRARARLRELSPRIDTQALTPETSRLPSVQRILYVLFTEGYFASHADIAIRRELCSEALRLATIVAEHPIGQTPETFALLALMHLHSARLDARREQSGGLLLLEEQDRTLWDVQQIGLGLEYLAKSAHGSHFSRYHAEAAIAAEHCLSPSFHATRWDKIAEIYKLLETIEPSAIHRLNRAIAVAEYQGPALGLAVLEECAVPEWLQNSFMWAAVLADLHQRNGNTVTASSYLETALKLAPSPAIKVLLQRRMCNVKEVKFSEG
jgi:RNA polymerase sigma factor (sigma-70 family)